MAAIRNSLATRSSRCPHLTSKTRSPSEGNGSSGSRMPWGVFVMNKRNCMGVLVLVEGILVFGTARLGLDGASPAPVAARAPVPFPSRRATANEASRNLEAKWLARHKGLKKTTDVTIQVVPGAKVSRTDKGLLLPATITN